MKLRVRFSLENLRLDIAVLNIPLFMADPAGQPVGLQMENQGCLPAFHSHPDKSRNDSYGNSIVCGCLQTLESDGSKV